MIFFKRKALVISVLFLTASQVSAAELLVLPSASIQRSELHDSTTADNVYDNDSQAKIDLFYTQNSDLWKALIEGLLSTDEQELERFELGWNLSATSTFWAGRFHNPISFWATTFHHGGFMQTAVRSPTAVSWEDDNGLFGTHITGILLQHDSYLADALLHWDLATGIGPKSNTEHLFTPYDILDPESGHGKSSTFSLNFFPDATAESFIGAGINRNTIEPSALAPSGLTQTVTALRAELAIQPWRAFTEAFWIDTEAGSQTDSMQSMYYQLEYSVSETKKVYARQEKNWGYNSTSYIHLLPIFTPDAYLVGLRVELTQHQALKAEFGRQELLDGLVNRYIALEWSMEWSPK